MIRCLPGLALLAATLAAERLAAMRLIVTLGTIIDARISLLTRVRTM
jgi:hypothetical protein